MSDGVPGSHRDRCGDHRGPGGGVGHHQLHSAARHSGNSQDVKQLLRLQGWKRALDYREKLFERHKSCIFSPDSGQRRTTVDQSDRSGAGVFPPNSSDYKDSSFLQSGSSRAGGGKRLHQVRRQTIRPAPLHLQSLLLCGLAL